MGMTDEEALHAFLSRLQLQLQEHVGARVQGNLDTMISMAQPLDVYCGSDGVKSGGNGGKGSKNMKKQKKMNVAQV